MILLFLFSPLDSPPPPTGLGIALVLLSQVDGGAKRSPSVGPPFHVSRVSPFFVESSSPLSRNVRGDSSPLAVTQSSDRLLPSEGRPTSRSFHVTPLRVDPADSGRFSTNSCVVFFSRSLFSAECSRTPRETAATPQETPLDSEVVHDCFPPASPSSFQLFPPLELLAPCKDLALISPSSCGDGPFFATCSRYARDFLLDALL